MTDLKRCPCGVIPKELAITGNSNFVKYAYVYGDCCGEWEIEFRTQYKDLESDECMALAIKAWNEAPRG